MLGKSLVVLRREGARLAQVREAQPWLRSSSPRSPASSPRAEVAQTVDAIASVQQPDGNIPWVPGGHTDPWNLVEAAMALDVGGRFAEAERAYEWLRRMQHARRLAGTRTTSGDDVKEHTLDTNVTCYVANGVWHHYLCTGDTAFLERLFPVVERAIDFALDHQHPTGEIEWDADPARIDGKGALLTGSSSIYSSLRCAIAAAERLGRERPDWELSLGSLAIAIAHRPERFLDKERWAMDWYYPILGGVLRGHAADARVAAKWDTFVVAGPRRALRVGPAVDHRRRDVRARDGARRDRAARPRPRPVRVGAVPAPRRRRVLDRHELRRRSLRRVGRVLHRRAADVEQRARSCSPRTRSAATVRPRDCSAARACPPASPPRSCIDAGAEIEAGRSAREQH